MKAVVTQLYSKGKNIPNKKLNKTTNEIKRKFDFSG